MKMGLLTEYDSMKKSSLAFTHDGLWGGGGIGLTPVWGRRPKFANKRNKLFSEAVFFYIMLVITIIIF